jgi:pyridinium-3,5-bisthiocarboxylic acid mononucleotide nickel chelatase
MKVLVIDPKIAGISGDMLIAALVDLTGSSDPLEPVADAICGLSYCENFSFQFHEGNAGGISAKKLTIEVREKNHRNHTAMRDSMVEITKKTGFSDTAKNMALRIIDDLLSTDAKLHRSGFHHHQMSSVDTLFDVAASITLLDLHGFFDGMIYGTPPVLGSGFTRIVGGEIACPAPATLEILCRHQIPYSSYPADGEMTTPTGAAIFANITSRIVDMYPPMTPRRVGYGTGSRSVQGRPSVLRVVEGMNFDAIQDRIVMLETNLDDAPGETVGYTVERHRDAGAVDVFVTTASGKKNRPVQILHIITNQQDYPGLLEILMDETGTLGVRILDIPRLVAHRTRQAMRVTVGGEVFDISVKTSTVNGNVVAKKPEYEDLKKIARHLNLPLNRVREEVLAQLGILSRDMPSSGWES